MQRRSPFLPVCVRVAALGLIAIAVGCGESTNRCVQRRCHQQQPPPLPRQPPAWMFERTPTFPLKLRRDT